MGASPNLEPLLHMTGSQSFQNWTAWPWTSRMTLTTKMPQVFQSLSSWTTRSWWHVSWLQTKRNPLMPTTLRTRLTWNPVGLAKHTLQEWTSSSDPIPISRRGFQKKRLCSNTSSCFKLSVLFWDLWFRQTLCTDDTDSELVWLHRT